MKKSEQLEEIRRRLDILVDALETIAPDHDLVSLRLELNSNDNDTFVGGAETEKNILNRVLWELPKLVDTEANFHHYVWDNHGFDCYDIARDVEFFLWT